MKVPASLYEYLKAYTSTELAELVKRILVIPPGGEPGQILVKRGEDDFDVWWRTVDAPLIDHPTADYEVALEIGTRNLPPKTLLHVVFTTNTDLLDDVTLEEENFILKGANVRSIIKLSDTEYTLELSGVTPATLSVTLDVKHNDVTYAPVEIVLGIAPEPPGPVAPIGWYGIWYPDNAGTFPTFDGDAAILLEGTVELKAPKGTKSFVIEPNETDWNAIDSGPPSTFVSWDDHGVQAFILVKAGTWGAPQMWDDTEAFNQTPAAPGNLLTGIVIGGATYNGFITDVVGGVSPVKFKFS